jgi:hypothetical protein
VEERPFQEIADRLGTTLGAVYTRKNRLIGKLKDKLEKELRKTRDKGREVGVGRASRSGET